MTATTAAGSGEPVVRAGGRSVLIIDDEPTIGEVVARYLQRAGYETRVAADGAQALAAAAQRRPDLVVLDVMLPGIDGLRLMSRLRDQDHGPLGVILLTARAEEADRIAGLRLGADDYVVKPFSPAELVARVDAVLRRVDPPAGEIEPLQLGEITGSTPGRAACSPAARRPRSPRASSTCCCTWRAIPTRCSPATS